MKIGFIGAGAVTKSIAREALATGHEVLISSRTLATAKSLSAELGGAADAVTFEEAADADIVVLAVPWLQRDDALGRVADWSGRILVDATNPFTQVIPTLILEDLGGRSASDLVAASAPGARVVKAFNSITMHRFDQGARRGDARRALFVSGDDAEAKATVRELIEAFGFRCIDLGDLTNGGVMQQAGGPLAGLDILVGD